MNVIRLAAEGVSLSIAPELGGKITSLFDERHGREWLEQFDGDLSRRDLVATSFDDGDMCGWDEIMPTIAPCRTTDGALLPDHGDLWRTSWDVLARGESTITTRARGISVNYVLDRTLTLHANGLRVDYVASTEAETPRALLWAAHPLFSLQRGTRVILNRAVTSAVELDSTGARSLVPWPRDGMDVVGSLPEGTGRKLFVDASPATVAKILDPSGTCLELRWSTEEAPFLGIWLDHCSLSRHPVVSLEPTSGGDDALEVATRLGPVWEISSTRDRRWSIDVTLGRQDPRSEMTKRP